MNVAARFDLVTVSAPGPAADTVRDLFLEYGETLGFNTCYAGLEEDVAVVPGVYGPPRGCLLLARSGGDAAGCVGVRPLDAERCEMKRLYVRPQFRRLGAGRLLTQSAIEWARRSGYRTISLDTLPTMLEAHALYASFGFKPCASYYDNTLLGSDCYELALTSPAPTARSSA